MSAVLVALTLLRSYGIWNAGEVAGFTPDKAAELIAAGIAAPVEGKADDQSAEPEPAPEPAPAAKPTGKAKA